MLSSQESLRQEIDGTVDVEHFRQQIAAGAADFHQLSDGESILPTAPVCSPTTDRTAKNWQLLAVEKKSSRLPNIVLVQSMKTLQSIKLVGKLFSFILSLMVRALIDQNNRAGR